MYHLQVHDSSKCPSAAGRGPSDGRAWSTNSNSLDLSPSTLHLFFPFAFHVYSRLVDAQISGLRAISALPRTEINCRDAGRVSRGAYNRYRRRVDIIKSPMPDMAGGRSPAKTTCHFRVVTHSAPLACCTCSE